MLKTKNNFITTVIVSVFIVLTAVSGVFFLFLKVLSERDSVTELKKTILQNNKKSEENKILTDAIDRLKKEKETISAIFLKEEDFVRLIKSLESAGEASGVSLKINSISPTDIDKKTNPQVSFTAKGSFERIFRYMNMLENIPYLTTIENVALQNIQDAKDKSLSGRGWQALFNLRLESYEKN